MSPEEKLMLAVKHALRIERAHLMDLQEQGEQDESMAVSATRYNIKIYREALEYHKLFKKDEKTE